MFVFILVVVGVIVIVLGCWQRELIKCAEQGDKLELTNFSLDKLNAQVDKLSLSARFYQLGETYIYLWGQNYRSFVSSLFINECYLIQLTFNTPTKEFDRYSYVCTLIKNVKDVDINAEYDRLIKNSNYTEMNEHWMLKNRK